jgi:hypothetical protein
MGTPGGREGSAANYWLLLNQGVIRVIKVLYMIMVEQVDGDRSALPTREVERIAYCVIDLRNTQHAVTK